MKEERGSTRGLVLTISIPKGTCMGGHRVEGGKPEMGYIDNKVFHAWFLSTLLAEELLCMSSLGKEAAYP